MIKTLKHISWIHHPHQFIRKYDLQKMYEILALLGNPHMRLPPTIHLAGTNGKGSTLATMHSILRIAGYKVHTYTSPHLLKINERITLESRMISDEYLLQLAEKVESANKMLSDSVSFFEGMTAVAMLAFAEQTADVLLLETGMGGRLDATNVVQPVASVITAIDFDHIEYLGNTLEEIAAQKAGIFKKDSLATIGHQQQCVTDILLKLASKVGVSRLLLYDRDYTITSGETDDSYFYYQQYIDQETNALLKLPNPKLHGEHQKFNASTAIATLLGLKSYFPAISIDCIQQGLRAIEWPGRLQLLAPSSYAHLCSDKVTIWLDGAHNEAGATALASWLASILKKKSSNTNQARKVDSKEREHIDCQTRLYIIYSCIYGKCSKTFFHKILEKLDSIQNSDYQLKIYITSILCEERACSELEIYKQLEKFIGREIVCEIGNDIPDILGKIEQESGQDGGLVIVTGSLFLVSDFLSLLRI